MEKLVTIFKCPFYIFTCKKRDLVNRLSEIYRNTLRSVTDKCGRSQLKEKRVIDHIRSYFRKFPVRVWFIFLGNNMRII